MFIRQELVEQNQIKVARNGEMMLQPNLLQTSCKIAADSVCHREPQ